MPRSAKTKHVLDLVGSESVKKPLPSTLREPSILRETPAQETQSPPNTDKIPPKTNFSYEDVEMDIEAIFNRIDSESRSAEESPKNTKDAPIKQREGITVIVTELINQEIKTVVERFNLTPSDSNLWELTRTVIENIRPEFSRNEEEYFEKCEKLRPRVIKEMTRAAVRVAAKEKKKSEN